ncbi:MAG: YtxH domain-containing protein [Bacteroidota bacterium]
MSKKLLLGIIAGAAAGTLIGILIAPDKGANTRNNLARNMRASVKKLTDTYHHWRIARMMPGRSLSGSMLKGHSPGT